MNSLNNFAKIIDRHTVIVCILTLFATHLSRVFGIYADLPFALLGIAIIFPIVFSINSAYRRREQALEYLASLKGHAIAIYYAHRDWAPDAESPEAVALRSSAKDLNTGLFNSVRDYLSAEHSVRANFEQVYAVFSQLSRANEELRAAQVPANEISRVNQYLRALMVDFEKLRNILTYRTPVTLRAYSKIFLNSFPILYAPHFARLGEESFAAVSYTVALVYGVVLVSLDNIQEDLENPYNQVGEDDIDLDFSEDYRPVFE